METTEPSTKPMMTVKVPLRYFSNIVFMNLEVAKKPISMPRSNTPMTTTPPASLLVSEKMEG